jgi:lysozyme
MKMKASNILIAAIKRFESVRLTAYQDSVGVWTIGYGHTACVKKGDRITQAQADAFLRDDLSRVESTANKLRNVSTQGRFDAVVDFIFNCGAGNFMKSTLKQYIELGKPTWMCQEQFLRWVNAGGRKSGGLVSRRIWEANRFNE